MSEQVDVRVHGSGSVYLLEPVTEAAQEWIDENIPDDAQYLGKNLAVEHRYVDHILEGMQNDGLVVQS